MNLLDSGLRRNDESVLSLEVLAYSITFHLFNRPPPAGPGPGNYVCRSL